MDPEPMDEAPLEPSTGGRNGAAADDAYPGQRELPGYIRLFFTISWSSFLSASVATMFCFALVDPAPIAEQFAAPGETFSRTTVYSFGFLFFWAVSALAAAMAAWMLAPRRS
jgi:hypothetical protein